MTRPAGDPFAALQLDPGADPTDDDVRAAWRRIAAATHPDRGDGGDPAVFATAAAAYADLRTAYGRGEARASLAQPSRGDSGRRLAALAAAAVHVQVAAAAVAAAVWHGRPARLAVRVVAASSAAAFAVIAAGHGPAGPALATGAATWLLLTGRRDLLVPRSKRRSAAVSAGGDRPGRVGGPR